MQATLAPVRFTLLMCGDDIVLLHLNRPLMDEGHLSPGMIYFPIHYPNTAEAQHLYQLGRRGREFVERLEKFMSIGMVQMFRYGAYLHLVPGSIGIGRLANDLDRLLVDFLGEGTTGITIENGDLDYTKHLDNPLA